MGVAAITGDCEASGLPPPAEATSGDWIRRNERVEVCGIFFPAKKIDRLVARIESCPQRQRGERGGNLLRMRTPPPWLWGMNNVVERCRVSKRNGERIVAADGACPDRKGGKRALSKTLYFRKVNHQ